MIIYRIERECGEGPYEPTSYGSDYHNRRNHPLHGPQSDCDTRELSVFWNSLKVNNELAIEERNKWIHGFSSLAQLFAWFPKKNLERMANTPFLLSQYEVNRRLIKIGKYQCLFKRQDATLIQRHAPNALNYKEVERSHELWPIIEPHLESLTD